MTNFAQTLRPTCFGFFDQDQAFQQEADGLAIFIPRRLGSDVLSVELTKKQIWACFEEATCEYGRLVNEMRTQNDLVSVLGMPTGSTDITNAYLRPTMEYLFRLADPYASTAGVGGSYDMTLGYINLTSGKQDYSIYNDLYSAEKSKDNLGNIIDGLSGQPVQMYLTQPSGSRGKITLQEVFHFEPFAAQNFLLNASNVTNFLASNFNYESYVNSTIFYVLPVFEDVLRRQMLETAFRVRRSNYSYEIIGSNIRVYPIPVTQSQVGKMYVKVFNGQLSATNPTGIGGDLGGDDTLYGINSPANMPYNNISYSNITSPGRQFIREFTLALCKELLGIVRGKFQTLPVPNDNVTLNYETLISQGREDQARLRDKLVEWLQNFTTEKLMAQQAAIAASIQANMKFIPMKSAVRIG